MGVLIRTVQEYFDAFINTQQRTKFFSGFKQSQTLWFEFDPRKSLQCSNELQHLWSEPQWQEVMKYPPAEKNGQVEDKLIENWPELLQFLEWSTTCCIHNQEFTGRGQSLRKTQRADSFNKTSFIKQVCLQCGPEPLCAKTLDRTDGGQSPELPPHWISLIQTCRNHLTTPWRVFRTRHDSWIFCRSPEISRRDGAAEGAGVLLQEHQDSCDLCTDWAWRNSYWNVEDHYLAGCNRCDFIQLCHSLENHHADAVSPAAVFETLHVITWQNSNYDDKKWFSLQDHFAFRQAGRVWYTSRSTTMSREQTTT